MTRGRWMALILAFMLASLTAGILANGNGLKVEFAKPAPNSTLAQDKVEVVVSVIPTDRKLARAELFVDGKPHDSVKLGAKPYQKVRLTWSTLDFSTGLHKLSVRLIDSEGSVAEAEAQFTLDRSRPAPVSSKAPETASPPAEAPPASAQERPRVKIVKPAPNAELVGTVEVTIEAQHTDGLSAVFLLIDGSHVFISNVSPYVFTWDTTKWLNGSHTLMAKASSPKGIEGISQTFKVLVNNPGGRTEMESPSAEAQPAAAAKQETPVEPARQETAGQAVSAPAPASQTAAAVATPSVQPPADSAQPKSQPAAAVVVPVTRPAASAANRPPERPIVAVPSRSAPASIRPSGDSTGRNPVSRPPSAPARAKPEIAPAESQTGQPTVKPSLPGIHVVTPGQGLLAVARLYGVSVKELASVNGLEPDSRLAVGQKLLLPVLAPILFVSGKHLESDVAPALRGWVLFGPLRHIVASAGGSTEWKAKQDGGGTATAYLKRESLTVGIGEKTAILSGSKIALAVAPYLEKGRTMVPIRLLQSLLGWAIHYQASTRRADIGPKQT